jgi:hypothetical protein
LAACSAYLLSSMPISIFFIIMVVKDLVYKGNNNQNTICFNWIDLSFNNDGFNAYFPTPLLLLRF